MKFYARLSPGIAEDFAAPLEVVLHQPRKATSGVVVKIWEHASYTDLDGRYVEDHGDDLLIELHGDVAADAALKARGRGKFVIAKTVVPKRDSKTPLAVLKLRVEGDQTVYDAPIPSTDGELHAQNFEIGLSVEHGGSEVFRSKVPTFIRHTLRNPQVDAKRLLGFKDDKPSYDEEDEVMIAGRFATIGTPSEPTTDGTLVVLGLAIVGMDGRLAPCDGDGKRKEGELVLLRTHRDLYAHVTREVPAAGKTTGPSKISMRLCYPIEPDGTIAMDVPHVHRRHDLGVDGGES